MKPRRSELEITFAILTAISHKTEVNNLERKFHNTTNLTSIQLSAGLSYNKLKKHVLRLEKFNMLTLTPRIELTPKGCLFLHEYEIILKQSKRLDDFIYNTLTDQERATFPQNLQEKMIDNQQLLNVQYALIAEYEKKLSK